MSLRTSPFAPRAFVVEGLAAVAEYVRHRPACVREIVCVPREKPAVERLVAALTGARPKVRLAAAPAEGASRGPERARRSHLPRADHEAALPASTAPVWAQVELAALPEDALLSRLARREDDVLVAVDHVQDPRNLGAILRTAAFFGVREVLAPERRQALLTQASVATAQGGLALTDLVAVVNLGRTLARLKDEGYWLIATAMDGEPLARVVGQYRKVVLILGSEDTGVSHQLRKTADRAVAIKGRSALDSLNVSVAAGIAIHAFTASL